MKRSSVVGIVLALGAAVSIEAGNWPQFRGPTGQGTSAEIGLPLHWSATSNVAWKTEIPGQGWSSPVVHGERVFLTTAAEDGVSLRLLSLDRTDGKVVWNREVFRQTLTRKEDRNSHATPTPATDGERVYILSFNGAVGAVDYGGKPVWTNADFHFYSQHGIGVSPILWEDLLIVAFDPSSDGEDKSVGWRKPWDKAAVIALDKRAGRVRWVGRRGASRIAHVTPVIWKHEGQVQLIGSAGDVVQGFDPRTGERLWSAFSQGEGVVPSPAMGDGLVFTTSGFERTTMRAVRLGGSGDVTATHIAWQQTKVVPMVPSLLYVKPWLFAVNDRGVAVCIKADTGDIIWQQRLGGDHSASPVYADGRVYFLGDSGTTTVIEARDEYRVLAQNPLGEKCQASMAVSEGKLFIRTERNLYCIGR